jgi:hypothetical protein
MKNCINIYHPVLVLLKSNSKKLRGDGITLICGIDETFKKGVKLAVEL